MSRWPTLALAAFAAPLLMAAASATPELPNPQAEVYAALLHALPGLGYTLGDQDPDAARVVATGDKAAGGKPISITVVKATAATSRLEFGDAKVSAKPSGPAKATAEQQKIIEAVARSLHASSPAKVG